MTESDLQAARNSYSALQRARDEGAVTFTYVGARKTRAEIDRFESELKDLAMDADAEVHYLSDVSTPGRYVFEILSYSPRTNKLLFKLICDTYPRRRFV